MALACKNLAKPEIKNTITRMSTETDPVVRLQDYMRPEFKLRLLQLAARWYAMQLISQEYQTGVAAARVKVETTSKKAPWIEDGRRILPKLAEKLKFDVDKELQELDAAAAALKGERDKIPTASATPLPGPGTRPPGPGTPPPGPA